MNKPILKSSILIIALAMLSSCGSLLRQSYQPTEARLGEETQSTIALKSLPEPKEKIVVAVYKFTDQTGQYKPSENGAGFSTAVTQGATSILLKALENSSWFIPIERENVANLLNERKIIRSSRTQFNNNQALPPLLYAGVILEGGIISYDANVITGGAGVRYFGTGASGQYRQDRVTIYLRAVSTSNGKILKTVYTSKTILSQSLDSGIFRYVKFRHLLEAETGVTYNEPSEIAITEAIEKAVQSLIVEGVTDGLWQLKEARESVSELFLEYKKEKELIPQTDIFGKRLDNRRKHFAFGASTSSLLYQGDYPDPIINTGVEIGATYSYTPSLAMNLNYGIGKVASQYYTTNISYLDLIANYRMLPYDIFTPYFLVGGGFITENNSSRFDFSNTKFSKVNVGLGFEYMLNTSVGLKGAVDYNYIFSDALDAVEQGKYNDFYWRANIGINVYFGNPLEGDRKFDYGKKQK